MRKICILIVCIMILQILCGCAGKKQEFQDPVNFFYCNKEFSYNSPTGVIRAEVREGAGFHGNLTACLRAYMLGPSSTDLQRLIPTNVYMVSCENMGDEVTIVMSSQFSELSGVELSAACSALLLTVHDFTGAETLRISAKDSRLDDKDELLLNLADIVLIDTVNE